MKKILIPVGLAVTVGLIVLSLLAPVNRNVAQAGQSGQFLVADGPGTPPFPPPPPPPPGNQSSLSQDSNSFLIADGPGTPPFPPPPPPPPGTSATNADILASQQNS
jgi:hypothetical protein